VIVQTGTLPDASVEVATSVASIRWISSGTGLPSDGESADPDRHGRDVHGQ
jgi:hypothetical protein